MLEEEQGAPTLGRGRHLAEPAFATDDGSADAGVRDLLAAAARGRESMVTAARALRTARLLTCVVAVLDETDPAGGDKDSHMAVVSMLNERGEKGLLAFSGVDALSAWDPQGRPVPALGRDIAVAAIDDGATAVVVDVAGPARCVVTGAALDVLAGSLDIEAVTARLLAALAPLTSDGWADAEVVDARAADVGVDVIVRLTAVAGGHPDGRRLADLAGQAARTIEGRTDLHRLVPGGIGVTTA